LQAYLRLKLGKISRTARSTPPTAKIQTGLKATTPRAVAGRIRNSGKKEPPTETTPQKTSATQRTEIIKALQEKYGKAVIDTLLRQCQDNVIWLKRFLEKFGTPYEVRRLIGVCGDAARLNRLTSATEPQGLGAKGVYDASSYYGKALPEILKRSQSEVNAAVELMKLEKADGGHAVGSHGPQVTDAQLKHRINTAIAPDGRVSFTHTSSRFDSFSEMLKIREYAINEYVKEFNTQNPGINLDITKPPSPQLQAMYPANPNRVMLRGQKISTQPITGRKSIGTSFTVPDTPLANPGNLSPAPTIRNTTKFNITSGPAAGKKGWPSSEIVELKTPITQVQIALTWNGSKWVVGQFFPVP
jgi:hypothetical protein